MEWTRGHKQIEIIINARAVRAGIVVGLLIGIICSCNLKVCSRVKVPRYVSFPTSLSHSSSNMDGSLEWELEKQSLRTHN